MRSDDLFTGFTSEAATATASAPVLRKGPPQDDQVPVVSFLDDLKDKLKLRAIMPKRKTAEAEQLDELPDGGQYEKEDVNYRYATDEAHSCGNCQHFLAPGSCEIVAGLIRTIDVCDAFEPLDSGEEGVVQATFMPGMAEAVVQAEAFDPSQHPRGQGGKFGSGGGSGRVAPAKRKNGPSEFRKPFVPTSQMDIRQQRAYNKWADRQRTKQQRREPKRMFTVQAEVAPPGWEDTVKGMKKHPEITNPWALSWWMKGRGATPGGKTVQAELVGEAEVTPPGFEPVVKALKRKPGVVNPWAVAWSMKGKGITPNSETVVEATLEVGDLP